MSTFGELRVLLRSHCRKKAVAEATEQKEEIAAVAEVKGPEISHLYQESMKITPESWKTPAEPDGEAISGSSL